MIYFYVTFIPNEARYLFSNTPSKSSKIIFFVFLLKFQLLGVIQVVQCKPEIGCFFPQIYQIQHFCCFVTQLIKKLQQWSLCEVIEDILSFVMNTKRPLSDIWLLRYKQNTFGCFRKKSELQGEGYLAGQSRQINSYLAGQSRQIIPYLAGHVPPNNFLFGGTCPVK